MSHVTLLVPEVHCDNCKAGLEGAVGALSGVDMVEVSVPDASIEVAYDDSVLDLDSIKSAIEAQGYAVFG